MLTESTGSGHGAADAVYSYHPHYVDAIAMRRDGGGNQHYFLQDANFNVTAVTDWTGTVVERYNYTPCGDVTIMDANFADDADGKSDIDNELLYTGRRLDPETGLQLNRNRFYAAGLGRWVSRDPIGYLGSQWNLYEYVNGMPLVGVDPSGEAIPAIIWGIGIGIGLLGSGGCGGPAPPPWAPGAPAAPGVPAAGCAANPVDAGFFPIPPAGTSAELHYAACAPCNTSTDGLDGQGCLNCCQSVDRALRALKQNNGVALAKCMADCQ